MQLKPVLVFFFCFIYLTIQGQNNKIPENKFPNLGYSNTFSWNPSDKKYGIDAEIQFSLSYYAFEDKVLVAQNVKIEKGNTIYHEGKTYTKQEVGEKAYNQIRVQEVDFKVTLTNGKRSVDVFFTDVMPQEEDHVRQFGWADVLYGDYHADRKQLDHSTTEKFDATINANKKMIYSNNFKVSNVELLDAESYNIPDDRATKDKQKKKEEDTKNVSSSTDDFWNGKTNEAKKTTKSSDDDFWNGNSDKPTDISDNDDFWNGNENKSDTSSDFWNTGATVEEQIQSLKDLAKKSGDQYIGEKVVKEKTIIVKYRDHGKIDGDRVRITQNDQLIKSNVTLTSSFSSVEIDLKKGINKIMFEALNEGSAGSNTAEFKVTNISGEILYSNEWSISTGYKGVLLIIKI